MHHATLIGIFLLFPAALQAAGDELRVTCPLPEVGLQCSLDCTELGYCDESNNWLYMGTCSTGYMCIGAICVQANTCPTVSTSSVICSDSSLKMPNLDDTTCSTYYKCRVTSSSVIGYGELTSCPTGTVFDSCSGDCISGSCRIPEDCSENFKVLTANAKLSYVCMYDDTVVWATCPNGIFLTLTSGPECFVGVSSTCSNGSGNDSDSDSDNNSDSDNGNGGVTCTVAGRFPITGTDCGYLQCYSDLSYTIFPCRSGYHYDEGVQGCVVGTCNGILPSLLDNAGYEHK